MKAREPISQRCETLGFILWYASKGVVFVRDFVGTRLRRYAAVVINSSHLLGGKPALSLIDHAELKRVRCTRSTLLLCDEVCGEVHCILIPRARQKSAYSIDFSSPLSTLNLLTVLPVSLSTVGTQSFRAFMAEDLKGIGKLQIRDEALSIKFIT
jgi:hypothetical protein